MGNSSGCRVMALVIEVNICRRGFWGCFGMEMPNGDVDEKHI